MKTDLSRELGRYYRLADGLIIFALFSFIGLAVMLHFSLTAGDWDYWIDWRDRRWWPLV
ncbi:MAG: methane monooxygenase/ammonia monooxygenase subunit A, partial [Nitrospinaceae bacterium]